MHVSCRKVWSKRAHRAIAKVSLPGMVVISSYYPCWELYRPALFCTQLRRVACGPTRL